MTGLAKIARVWFRGHAQSRLSKKASWLDNVFVGLALLDHPPTFRQTPPASGWEAKTLCAPVRASIAGTRFAPVPGSGVTPSRGLS